MTSTQQRLVGVLVLVALLAAAWMLLLKPAVDGRQTARDELAQAQTAEATAQQSLQTAEEALRVLPENRRVLATLSKVVPPQAESAALLDRLDDLARRSGVSFDSLDLAGATDDAAAPAAGTDGAAGSSATAQQVPVTLKVRGSYPRVVALLERLHGRGATLGGGRLLRLDAVALAPEQEESGSASDRLAVDVTAVAFVLPAAGAPAAAAAQPSESAGAGTTATAPGGTG